MFLRFVADYFIMATTKIFNDPVYGFISIPYGLIFNLIEHPYFQRLRRIKQVSLTHYVYPGALHTRFHHALGAYHLMTQVIDVLRSKGTVITDEEALAAGAAILLHDIGHGPFSHTLENTLINVTHETISGLFMEKLNAEMNGQLDLAIRIFRDEYPKKFLHQLVSSQLDMDRMDYLTRDSFFTGVYEGVIGYDRILKMLAVHDGELVVEEKGIYSIEKFLIARRLMYWQVYLHKTVLSAEQMLIQILKRAKYLAKTGANLYCPPDLQFFLYHNFTGKDFQTRRDELLDTFARLDDYDIFSAIKAWMKSDDRLLAYLATGLINRRLFKLELSSNKFAEGHIHGIQQRISEWWPGESHDLPYLFMQGKETNSTYNTHKEEIKILFKNGEVEPMSKNIEQDMKAKNVTKYYLCYPKEVFQIPG